MDLSKVPKNTSVISAQVNHLCFLVVSLLCCFLYGLLTGHSLLAFAGEESRLPSAYLCSASLWRVLHKFHFYLCATYCSRVCSAIIDRFSNRINHQGTAAAPLCFWRRGHRQSPLHGYYIQCAHRPTRGSIYAACSLSVLFFALGNPN